MTAHQAKPRITEDWEDIGNFDEAGYLRDSARWNPKTAQQIAYQEAMGDLSEEEWRIIHYVRAYYRFHGDWPLPARIARDLAIKRRYICRKPPEIWFKIAGLPNPRGRMMWGGTPLPPLAELRAMRVEALQSA